MVGMWAMLVVLCLAGQAHAQLGEGADAQQGDTRAWRSSDSDDDYGGKEEAWIAAGAEEEEVVMLRTPRRWKPLMETYLGCLPQDDGFTDSIMYVNLTEVMEEHGLDSVQEACYHLCLYKAPLTIYLTVSPALNGSVDACGCHLDNELNLDNMVEDEGCDKMDLYRVYCGPYNIQCFGRAGGPCAPSLPLLALPLLLALLSGLADVGPTSPTYFGFNR